MRNHSLSMTGKDRSRYLIYRDSLNGVISSVYIPSTSFRASLHYKLSAIDGAYSIGFQWEDIILKNIFNIQSQKFESVTFNNDYLFHQVHFDAELLDG
jgi:hypothetical protein